MEETDKKPINKVLASIGITLLSFVALKIIATVVVYEYSFYGVFLVPILFITFLVAALLSDGKDRKQWLIGAFISLLVGFGSCVLTLFAF